MKHQIEHKRTSEYDIFVGDIYEYTCNKDGHFIQRQIDLFHEIIRQLDLDIFNRIPIIVSTPRIEDIQYDILKIICDYIDEVWKI